MKLLSSRVVQSLLVLPVAAVPLVAVSFGSHAAFDGGSGFKAGAWATLAAIAPWWQRGASLLPLIMLVAGLMMIDRWDLREKVMAAAEIDAQLLSDTLPPTAYTDPGFGEFLRGSPSP